ncbi:MAG: hypothetical protein ACYDH6_22495 [Acidimicrobiales bacterium]
MDRTKTVELRRSTSRISAGSIALIYASSPQRALVGAMRVQDVVTGSPATLWRDCGHRTGLCHAEFNSYLAGASKASALLIDEVCAFPRAVTLSALRSRWTGFVAPQSYRFLEADEARALVNGEAALIASLGPPPGPTPDVAAELFCGDGNRRRRSARA